MPTTTPNDIVFSNEECTTGHCPVCGHMVIYKAAHHFTHALISRRWNCPTCDAHGIENGSYHLDDVVLHKSSTERAGENAQGNITLNNLTVFQSGYTPEMLYATNACCDLNIPENKYPTEVRQWVQLVWEEVYGPYRYVVKWGEAWGLLAAVEYKPDTQRGQYKANSTLKNQMWQHAKRLMEYTALQQFSIQCAYDCEEANDHLGNQFQLSQISIFFPLGTDKASIQQAVNLLESNCCSAQRKEQPEYPPLPFSSTEYGWESEE